jgi:hypothetical protein
MREILAQPWFSADVAPIFEEYESWKNVNIWLIPSWKSVRRGMKTP